MISAPDFDRKMLLMLTQLAHEHHLKHVLLNVLAALLRTLSSESGTSNVVEGITLVRYGGLLPTCALSLIEFSQVHHAFNHKHMERTRRRYVSVLPVMRSNHALMSLQRRICHDVPSAGPNRCVTNKNTKSPLSKSPLQAESLLQAPLITRKRR